MAIVPVKTTFRLGDFPFVYLSYDEPWADNNWSDLKSKVPNAVRVHGVKGLDACHKAAADAVSGDWVVTIDADTIINANTRNIELPEELLQDQFRFDWLSRNHVNGLWSGNGCIKLWPKRLLRDMRTHEVAPDELFSLDHDISNILPGKSHQVIRPERVSETNPAQTARHAFRAGFREALFLHQLAINTTKDSAQSNWKNSAAAHILGLWCSVGRHARNGLWMIYGARLGLLWHVLDPDCDVRAVNDYDWLDTLWTTRVAPKFGRPSESGNLRRDWVEADICALGKQIAEALGFFVPEFDNDQSRHLAYSGIFSANLLANCHDSLGYQLYLTDKSKPSLNAALDYFEMARCFDKGSSFYNIGRTLLRLPNADENRANVAWHFRAAIALGNEYAPSRLADLEKDGKFDDDIRPAQIASNYPIFTRASLKSGTNKQLNSDFCFVLDEHIDAGPDMHLHVPDPNLCANDVIIGYCSRCTKTGVIVPTGIRFGAIKSFSHDPAREADAVLPIVLGLMNGLVQPDVGTRFDDSQTKWLATVRPAVAPKSLWLSASDNLEKFGKNGESLAKVLRRTAYAVWGIDPKEASD